VATTGAVRTSFRQPDPEPAGFAIGLLKLAKLVAGRLILQADEEDQVRAQD
jgi:hypothetical protein